MKDDPMPQLKVHHKKHQEAMEIVSGSRQMGCLCHAPD